MIKATIYKVNMPSIYAWPPGNVTLASFFLEADALDYINSYPNMLLRPFLMIDREDITFHETD